MMSARTKPPFRADHVGSFLRPKSVIDAREKLAKGEIRTDWRFIPSAELGGDSFGYDWIDDEQGLEREPDFGKALKLSKAFDTPPYYAIQIFPLARKNFGGAKTDLQCRVLDKHFEPIGALYAAGEVAGMAGGHINGRAGLEGTMLGPSIFSGRVAGGWAAHAAGHGRGFVGKPNRS